MLIAIIDDGINPLSNIDTVNDLYITSDGRVQDRPSSELIFTDHGTTCAAIIKKYAPEAEFCSIRIFTDHTLKTSCSQLVAALEWCYQNKIPIIHMSVGSSLLSDYNKIRPIIAKILKQRQIIIAARSNRGHYSIPACLSGVFGVAADECLSNNKYSIAPILQDQYIFRASARHNLDLPLRGEFSTQITNSFAAPTITAIVHNILSEHEPFNMTVSQVYNLLFPGYDIPLLKPDFIDNAYIINPHNYPVLKQHLFFNFLGAYIKLSDFQQNNDGKYDIVYLNPKDKIVPDAIIRYLNNEGGLYENLLYGGIIKNTEIELSSALVWDENMCEYTLQNYDTSYKDVNCPVINIYGYDLHAVDILCQLRDLFLNDGYQCSCICNYPYAYLYGLEYIINVPRDSAIRYVNDIYQPDVVICCFKEVCCQPIKNPDEYYIIFDNLCNNFELNKEDIITNHSIIPCSFDENDVLFLYQNIIQYFN